MALGAFGSSNP
jgi:integrase